MSSGFADARTAILTRIASEWGSTTPVRIENKNFAEPKGDPWLSVHLQPAGAVNGAIGTGTGSLERYAGVLIAQLFGPENSGTDALIDLADTFASIFKHVQISSGNSGTITFDLPDIRNIGPREGAYQINVVCPFRRDRFET